MAWLDVRNWGALVAVMAWVTVTTYMLDVTGTLFSGEQQHPATREGSIAPIQPRRSHRDVNGESGLPKLLSVAFNLNMEFPA